MPRIDKKYIKVSVVGLAVVALVVGLSVGLTRGKSDKNASAAAANGDSGLSAVEIDECYSGKSGKMGKSGSRGTNSTSAAKAAKSTRMLVVPGTEDYMLDEDEAGEAMDGHRRKLRNELMRELETNFTGKAAKSASSSAKAAKSAGSAKSGKSGSRGNTTHCEPVIKDICDGNFTYSGKSGKSGGGSGSGKSGKSGGRLVNGTRFPTNGGYYSGKGGKSGSYGRFVNGTCVCPSGSGKSGKSGSVGGSGKSGKSGSYNMNMTGTNFTHSGKSGKSGSYNGSGKSGKSGSYGPGDGCSCDGAPTVCGPTPVPGPAPPAPLVCTCETQPWYAFDALDESGQRVCRRYACDATNGNEGKADGVFDSLDGCCAGFEQGKCIPSPKDCGAPPAPASSPCACEAQPWYAYDSSGTRNCARFGCDADVEADPDDVFDTLKQCCTGFIAGETCAPLRDYCDDGIPPAPTPGSIITPAPTLPPFPEISTLSPTSPPIRAITTLEPSSGSTPTVSTEVTGPPTKEDRGGDSQTSHDAEDSQEGI